MSVARYTETMAATQGPREIEIRAFRYVNGLLSAVTEGDVLARMTALRKNFQLWSMLLSDLMLPDNKLPQELKAHLASLALWAQNESNRAMFDDTRSLDALVVVNRDMIEALDRQAKVPSVPKEARPAAPVTAPAAAPRSLAATA